MIVVFQKNISVNEVKENDFREVFFNEVVSLEFVSNFNLFKLTL